MKLTHTVSVVTSLALAAQASAIFANETMSSIEECADSWVWNKIDHEIACNDQRRLVTQLSVNELEKQCELQGNIWVDVSDDGDESRACFIPATNAERVTCFDAGAEWYWDGLNGKWNCDIGKALINCNNQGGIIHQNTKRSYSCIIKYQRN